ncbi:MAG: c-type cytochrome [Gammaproteobacteria bacterium]|nr:c-type cytochrome [Gammaproteobacteria bacterium]
MKKLILSVLVAGICAFGAVAAAKSGNTEKGQEIYAKRCVWCHGEEGDGAGAAADRLNPPPRDFTSGQYKIMTTAFDGMVPSDEDLHRMIRDGMPGTAMPGWASLLKEEEMWDLVAYIKTFAGYDEEPPPKQVDYGTQVVSSPESIEKGKQLFHDDDRCTECHGIEGKGSATKNLKGDADERTWPRNLTKPWTFRGSNDPKDIYARISTGIPGTQMPSFADPVSKKKLSPEERWHVANYVVSLAKTDKTVRAENTVVKADRVVEGDLPAAPDDPAWDAATPTSFFLVPQIIAEERFFTPSYDSITVRALYNDKELAMLLEWDDRTKSIPGDEDAEKLSDPEIAEDAVSVQLPIKIPEGMEKPYFGMGDVAHPVNIWHWKSGTTETPESVHLMTGKGFADIQRRELAEAGLGAKGSYKDGTWRVVMKRPLATSDPEKDIQFMNGKFIPVAFAAWDGSNSEKGSKHTMTTWYWLLLKPHTGAKPFIAAFIVMILIAGALFWWARTAEKEKAAA